MKTTQVAKKEEVTRDWYLVDVDNKVLGRVATEIANVVGPICESADLLGAERVLPPTQEGDVLLIATAGAYGHAMSSRYNLREPAVEVVI